MIIRIQMKTKKFLKILRCVFLVETGSFVLQIVSNVKVGSTYSNFVHM